MTLTTDTRRALLQDRAALDAQFEIEQARIRQHGLDKMKGFIDSGMRYQAFRSLLEKRNELHPPEERISWDAWVESPENCCDSGTHLSVQVIDIFHDYFKLPLVLLTATGRAKYGIINPELECWIRDIASGKRTFEDGQAAAIQWLGNAENNSVKQLRLLMIETTIAYARQNAPEGTTQAHTNGWTVLNEGFPKRAGELRQMSRDQLLAWLGLASSDIGDNRNILANVSAAPEE